MFPFKYPVPQTDPPLSPRETLPSMYDLKSEDPEEPGLPDEFHDLQAIEPQTEEKPPRKWEVYEQILRIPYYVVFSRYTNRLRAFKLEGGYYQELELQEPRVWIPELELGLGLWQGEYQGIERLWLRWYDMEGNWIPTEAEQERVEKAQALQQAEQERQRAEQAEARLESLIERLRESGIDPEAFLNGYRSI